jgi:hypothetical protein
LARQILRRKNLVGFLKAVRKIFVGILVTEIVHRISSWAKSAPLRYLNDKIANGLYL